MLIFNYLLNQIWCEFRPEERLHSVSERQKEVLLTVSVCESVCVSPAPLLSADNADSDKTRVYKVSQFLPRQGERKNFIVASDCVSKYP